MWGTRPIEGLFHFLVLMGLLLHFLDDQQFMNCLAHSSWIAALVVGAQLEGLRMQQLVVTVPFTLHTLVYALSTSFYSQTFRPFGVINFLVWLLAMAAWIHSVHFVALVGATDFCRIKSATDKSLYSVGTRYIQITDKRLEAQVYYPMDRVAPQEEYTAQWFRDPERTINAMKNVFGPMFEIPYIPDFLLRTYTRIKVPMFKDRNLCERFASGKEALRPVIFSHGLSGDKANYMGVYHAMAANGHLVIAVNH